MTQPPRMSSDDQTQRFAPDEVLIRRLRSGDSEAGDELVTRHAKPLLAYLSRMTSSAAMAEELHQATWLSVLQHIERFDVKSSAGGFRAWLFRIATNKVNDLWRSKGRQRKAEDGLRLVIEEESPDASVHMADGEMVAKLKEAIDRLPEAQKQVVQMRYYANMKFVEIAEALGCPLNTALGRMHKALLKLRGHLEE